MNRSSLKRLSVRIVKAAVAASMLSASAAAFFGVRHCALAGKIQLVPAVLALDAAALALLGVLLALRARLYCEIVCPLGIAQDVVRLISFKKTRRTCSRLPDTRRRKTVRWTVFSVFLLAGLSGFSFMWLEPFGIFGRGVTLTGGLFFVVVLSAFFGKGRFWCNWICPVGTVLQAVSRFSVFKDRYDGCARCGECGKCLGK